MKFEGISMNKDGNYYIIYSYPSIQKIKKECRGKNKRELMIVGMHRKRLRKWIESGNLLKGCDEND